MNTIIEQLGLTGIVPVVVLDNESDAEPLAIALLAGGLPTMEITFRTAAAGKAIERVTGRVPGMLVGAGTVLTIDQARTAIDCGAKYIVSPGLNRNVVEFCQSRQVGVLPGVLTPTEIGAALELGLDVVKFFPSEPVGGLRYIEVIGAVFRRVMFIPSGGINESNFLEYLRNSKIHACGGSWMAKKELIVAGKFGEIEKLTTQAVGIMLGLRVLEGKKKGKARSDRARVLSRLLDLPVGVGTLADARKAGIDRDADVTLGTNFVERAVEYLNRKGISTKLTAGSGGATGMFSIDGTAFRLVQV